MGLRKLFLVSVFIGARRGRCPAQAPKTAREAARPALDWSLRGDALNERLAALAKKQSLDPQDYIYYRSPGPRGGYGLIGLFRDESCAVTSCADAAGRQFVVASQHSQGGGFRGASLTTRYKLFCSRRTASFLTGFNVLHVPPKLKT